jgi:hypothetical protein
MIQRGEVGIILFELRRENGILNNEIYAGMVIVIAITIVLSPFLMKGLYSCFNHRLQTTENLWKPLGAASLTFNGSHPLQSFPNYIKGSLYGSTY